MPRLVSFTIRFIGHDGAIMGRPCWTVLQAEDAAHARALFTRAHGPRVVVAIRRTYPAKPAKARRFITADGFTLHFVAGAWVDSLDPEAVDLTFPANAQGQPVDAWGKPLDGRRVA